MRAPRQPRQLQRQRRSRNPAGTGLLGRKPRPANRSDGLPIASLCAQPAQTTRTKAAAISIRSAIIAGIRRQGYGPASFLSDVPGDRDRARLSMQPSRRAGSRAPPAGRHEPAGAVFPREPQCANRMANRMANRTAQVSAGELALSSRKMSSAVSCKWTAATSSSSCGTDVALAIGAVMLGRVMSQASATVASAA